jgi:uncharacterized membrane protein
MKQLSFVVFAALLVATGIFTQLSIGSLPESVAIHFDAKGAADGWLTRDQYRLFQPLSLMGLPVLLVWLMAGLPRLTQGKGQIPDGEYWFAPERRSGTEAFLLRHACWLGCITVAFIFGAHIAIARANAVSPPTLASDRFLTMVLVYLVGLGWWLMTLLRHFQRPKS